MWAILHILSGEYLKVYYSENGFCYAFDVMWKYKREAKRYLSCLEDLGCPISNLINDPSYNYFNIKELQIIKLPKKEIQNVKIKK
jgi:hypothetical protein